MIYDPKLCVNQPRRVGKLAKPMLRRFIPYKFQKSSTPVSPIVGDFC